MDNIEQTISRAVNSRYKFPDKTRREAIQAIKYYRSLVPKQESFVFNDGREIELLNLNGTIPVMYKGNKYHIPICLWFLDNHPESAPMVYVKPTSDMLIKSSKHVDQNGKVYLPYLHEWNSHNSDVLGLIQILMVTFGETPPVYSRPKESSPSPYHMPYQPPASNPNYPTNNPLPYPTGPQPGMTPPSSGFAPYPTSTAMPTPQPYSAAYPSSGSTPYPPSANPTPYPPTANSTPYPPGPFPAPNSTPYPTPYPQQSSFQSSTYDSSGNTNTLTEEHIRNSLISAVGDRVRARLREIYGDAQAEVSVLQHQQTDLKHGKSKLETLINKMNSEKVELEKSIRIMKEKQSELEDSIEKHSESTESLDIDDAVVTTAPLYKQLLSAYAEDQATQDAIYYLGEALRKNVIDLDAYLKHVRDLSRKQFQLRATMIKCRRKANLPG